MSVTDQFRRNVRTFYYWLGALALLWASPLIALHLIERGTTLSRAAGVAVGVGGMLPWLGMIALVVHRGDEFVRRMHLIAIAFTAAAAMVVIVALSWLVRAWFIDTPDLMHVWVALMVMWGAALIVTKRYYERAQ
jgi:hypothetical protein